MNQKKDWERIKELEDQVEFLKAVIRHYSVPQLDSLFASWKNKTGVFRPNNL